jgi:retron-type reverse transcriptase
MYCTHGNNKRTVNATNTSAKNIEHHLLVARQKMGFRGSDIRLFLNWDKWVTQLELFNEHRTQSNHR